MAAVVTFYGDIFEPQSAPRSQLVDAPRALTLTSIPFSVRFPEQTDFDVTTSSDESDIRRAKRQLAQAMRAQTLPPPDISLGISPAPEKVPLPRVRPSAGNLMANLDALSLPDQGSPDPLSGVSAALKKVFAMLQPSGQGRASASPDSAILSDEKDAPLPTLAEKQAALYDISARTVYMPDGTRLEAHSGLAELMDDPTQVHVRNRGATPPQIYELTKREAPFHGVEALRMKPVGQGDLFGRTGLLTHSYLMGPNGDSNGCVSFKDYAAFLQAFKAGAVKRLIVVPSLADPTIMTAQKT